MSNYEQFLNSSLITFRNPDKTKRDILGVFTSFGDLRPKVEDFVFNDGTKKSLLQLEGTIPVNYKVPDVFITRLHKREPAHLAQRNFIHALRVEKEIRKSKKKPKSDLLGLIQILTIVFGEEPPVYSKAQTHNSPQGYPLHEQYPYPDVSSQYPGQSYTGYQPPVSANKQQTRLVSFNSNRHISGTKPIDSIIDNAATGGLEQVSGRKVTQNTESDECQASAEDFDIHCDPCFSENNFVEAEGFCLVCKEYFCKACLRYHRKFSATKTHKILEKDDMPRQ